MTKREFDKTVHYLDAIYGLDIIYDDEDCIYGFVCPECGEPIFYEDWWDSTLEECPICGCAYLD